MKRKNYGVTKAMLNSLSYDQLFRAWYGINNINLPHEMLETLTEKEIIEIFIGNHDLKYENSSLFEKVSSCEPESVYEIIKEARKCAQPPQDPAENNLQERISELRYYTRWSFLMSFRMPKKEVGIDFLDPNIDDIGKRDKFVYVNRIFHAIKSVYEKNIEKTQLPGYAARCRDLTREEIFAMTSEEYENPDQENFDLQD